MSGAEAPREGRRDVRVRGLERRHVLRRQDDDSVERQPENLARDTVAVLLIDVTLDLAIRFLRLLENLHSIN